MNVPCARCSGEAAELVDGVALCAPHVEAAARTRPEAPPQPTYGPVAGVGPVPAPVTPRNTERAAETSAPPGPVEGPRGVLAAEVEAAPAVDVTRWEMRWVGFAAERVDLDRRRLAALRAMRAEGMSLRAIGSVAGMSGQRVGQILAG